MADSNKSDNVAGFDPERKGRMVFRYRIGALAQGNKPSVPIKNAQGEVAEFGDKQAAIDFGRLARMYKHDGLLKDSQLCLIPVAMKAKTKAPDVF